MSAAQSDLLVESDGAVRVLTLHRPAAFNAFDESLKTQFRTALQLAADDPDVRAVLLTGTGRAFCAGQDLKEHAGRMHSDPEAVAATVVEFYNPVLRLLTEMPKPVIAAINGVAAGAGMGLALACDLRIAARSAVLRTAFVGVGLTLDSGLSWTLPRLVGAGRARRLAMLDEPLDAATALDWGAVDAVVDDDELDSAARRWARQLAAGPTAAYGWIKRSFAAAADGDLPAALAAEDTAQRASFESADHAGALASFLAKRPPEFTGR